MSRRVAALLMLVVLPGVAAVAVSGYYLLQDWAALTRAFRRFETLATAGDADDMRALFVAEAYQRMYRINCFADGVGVLLGAILTAIGIHGLCALGSHRGSGGG